MIKNYESVSTNDEYRSFEMRSKAITALSISGCILIFVFILYFSYIPNRPKAIGLILRQDRKEILNKIKAKNDILFTTYGWINEDQKIVKLPVNRAIQLTLPILNKLQSNELKIVRAVSDYDSDVLGLSRSIINESYCSAYSKKTNIALMIENLNSKNSQ